MGRFGWFVTGLILGVIVTLGALVYLKNARREAAEERAVAPIETPATTVAAQPALPPEAVPPPAPVVARPSAPVRSRPAARQAPEEVAEDAAAVGMTSRRPPAAPRNSDDAPITDVPY